MNISLSLDGDWILYRPAKSAENLTSHRLGYIAIMITRLAHINIQTADINRCVAFYRDGLGFPLAMTFVKDGKLAGAYFSVGDKSFIEAVEHKPVVGITHFSLETSDIDGFIASAADSNIACSPKKMGGCGTWATWLRDPDGNAFEVQQYTDRSMQFNNGVCEITWKI